MKVSLLASVAALLALGMGSASAGEEPTVSGLDGWIVSSKHALHAQSDNNDWRRSVYNWSWNRNVNLEPSCCRNHNADAFPQSGDWEHGLTQNTGTYCERFDPHPQ
jgi:hypothetical protein